MSARMLHLLRHGAPETPGLMMGRTDGAPTPEGIAACVARAAGLAVDAIVCSDLKRAKNAAKAIAAPLGLPVTVDPRWRELDFGDWDGLTPAAIDRDALGRFHDDPDVHPPPQGESWSALVTRVAAAIDDLSSSATLVVTHGGAMRAALACLCGFGQAQLWAFDLPYAALLSLKVWPAPHSGAQIVGLRA
ncbi:MAG: histidine phosphatase family protein [Sphingobium sp.]